MLSETVGLTYDPSRIDGKRFELHGSKNLAVPLESPDWLLVGAAVIAESEQPSLISLYGKPKSQGELDWLSEHPNGYFLEYHPAIHNSLIAFILLMADANLIYSSKGGLPQVWTMRQNTASLLGACPEFENAFPSSTWDNWIVDDSDQAIRKLHSIISQRSLGRAWNTYILTDEHSDFTFELRNGKIEFTGDPYYQFGHISQPGKAHFLDEITQEVRAQSVLFQQIDPFVYRTIGDIARWTALFRFVKGSNPAQWMDFYAALPRLDQTTPATSREVLETKRFYEPQDTPAK